jgi:hypothetical protein
MRYQRDNQYIKEEQTRRYKRDIPKMKIKEGQAIRYQRDNQSKSKKDRP